MQIFKKIPNYDFLAKRRLWITVSLVVIGVMYASALVKKPNWGVDFAGGTEIQVQFAGKVDPGQVRETIEAAGFPDANVQRFGDDKDNEFLVRVGRASMFSDEEFAKDVEPRIRQALPSLLPGRTGVDYSATEGDSVTVAADGALTTEGVLKAFEGAGFRIQDVRAITEGRQYSVIFKGVSDKVEQALTAKFPGEKPEVRRVEQVGAAVGNELKISAVKALVLAVLLILAYIGFRFDLAFGLGAVVALIHDALVVVGAYFLLGMEINTTTIAVALTIIGFSVNDTVVIYDRIRENTQKHKGRGLEKTINASINETMSRTLITNFTVLLSVIGLAIYTVGTLREFSFAMIVGIITGTYSTVFIASPVVLAFTGYMERRRERLKSAAGRQPPTPGEGGTRTSSRTAASGEARV